MFFSEQHKASFPLIPLFSTRLKPCYYDVSVSSWDIFFFHFSTGGSPEGTLTCETANGDLIEFGISASTTDSDCATKHLQTSLKDLLLGVDINQAKVNKLKSKHEQLNALLQQIHVASCLLHFCHPQTTANQDTAPISCNVTLQSEVNYFAVDYHVVVQVTNHSTVALTKTWSLVATLFEMDGSGSLLPQEMHLSLRKMPPSSHAFRLSQGLAAGQTLHFKVPVTYLPTCSGMRVQISLMLHNPELLQGEMKHSAVSPNCLVIPLAETVVDVIHFLHMRQPGCVLPQTGDPVSSLEEKVAELRCSHQNKRRELSQSYSVSEAVAGKICEN